MSRSTGASQRALRPVAPGERGGLHVAIIMDGNGRWAKRRGLPRAFGHREGVAALRRTVEAAPDYGIERLTVFGFSTENWRRPIAEVSELMQLLKSYVSSDLDRLAREGVRVHVIGRRDDLKPDILEVIDRAEARTRHNARFHLQVAFNYGGRADIVAAAQALAAEAAAGRIAPAAIDEAAFEAKLSTIEGPPPDLIVRTSGERRISNFLLWEAAYAELYFTDTQWPEFGRDEFVRALESYRGRERRFGRTREQIRSHG